MKIRKASGPTTSLKELRTRLGITVRDVEQQSQEIAEQQGNPEFFVSNNWITRLENSRAVPSIHKLFSLSTIYRVGITDLLPMFGIDLELLRKYEVATPTEHTHLLRLEKPDPRKSITFPVRLDPGFRVEETNLLSRMVQVWGEVPVAVLQTLDIKHGLYGYIGLQDFTMYPLLRPGSFVFIDDSLREVQTAPWRSELDRPIYFVELREGYVCCWCETRGEELVLIPHTLSTNSHRILPSREAEIIGQVTAVAMRLVGPSPDNIPTRIAGQLPKRQSG